MHFYKFLSYYLYFFKMIYQMFMVIWFLYFSWILEVKLNINFMTVTYQFNLIYLLKDISIQILDDPRKFTMNTMRTYNAKSYHLLHIMKLP